MVHYLFLLPSRCLSARPSYSLLPYPSSNYQSQEDFFLIIPDFFLHAPSTFTYRAQPTSTALPLIVSALYLQRPYPVGRRNVVNAVEPQMASRYLSQPMCCYLLSASVLWSWRAFQCPCLSRVTNLAVLAFSAAMTLSSLSLIPQSFVAPGRRLPPWARRWPWVRRLGRRCAARSATAGLRSGLLASRGCTQQHQMPRDKRCFG